MKGRSLCSALLVLMAAAAPAGAEEPRLEEMRDKTILVFTPHPDDDLFGAGGTIALLLPLSGGDAHAPIVYWVSLAFTFIGALVFSTIRSRRARIPQEAIIGICYAVASAASILAMSKATSESEHLKDMLVGNILAVSWPEVGKTALLYGAIGVFHYLFRDKFLAISMDHQAAEARGIPVRFWDFLFYASFGFVVTSSVAILLPDRALGRCDAVR